MDTPTFPPAWSADALANAVPLRLSQVIDFDTLCAGPPPEAANEPSIARDAATRSFLPPLPPLPPLRVG